MFGVGRLGNVGKASATAGFLGAAGAPSLNLDFANSKTLDERITFTRTSEGTYFDANGILKTAAANEPRIDHDPETGECLGLLIEESRTNLLLWSEDFDTGSWVRSQINITETVDPVDGDVISKLTENATNNTHVLFINPGYSTDTNYTPSVFAKAGERDHITFGVRDIADGIARAYTYTIDLTSGLVTDTFSSGAITSTGVVIEDVGDGWYRISSTFYFPAPVSTLSDQRLYIALSDDGIINDPNGLKAYLGDGTSGIYIWGAQLEVGSFATSYIKTEAAAVTRAADIASITGTNFSDWYRQGEGTLYVDFLSIGAPAATGGLVSINNNTTSVRPLSVEISAANQLVAVSTPGFTGATLVEMTPGNQYKIALAVNATEFGFSYNGSATTQQAGTVSATDATQLEIGGLAGQSTRNQNSHIKKIAYWPTRLPNATLQAMTA